MSSRTRASWFLGLALAAASAAAPSTSHAAQVIIGGQPVNPSRLIVRLPADPAARQAALNSATKEGFHVLRNISLVPGLVILEADGADQLHAQAVSDPRQAAQKLQTGAQNLSRTGGFAYVQYDNQVTASLAPTDPAFTEQLLWGLSNKGQFGGVSGVDINAEKAWNVTTGSPSVVVAVIDSGVRYTHVDLANQMWVNPDEIPGDNIDNDGDGFIDDIHGINAITSTGDPMDDNGHGTHVSGTIAAQANGGGRHVGVAWNVRLMGLKFLSAFGGGSASDAITCIDYAVQHGARISNNSWGGTGFDQALYDAINAARNRGHLFISASGNSGVNVDLIPHYPGAFDLDNILNVGAIDRNGQLASFSNFGAVGVDVAAPGVEIYSTYNGSDTDYQYLQGTSMACPHVTGIAALLASRYPNETYTQLRQRIIGKTVPLTSLLGKVATGGRADAFLALDVQPSGNLELLISPQEGTTFAPGVATNAFSVRVSDVFPVRGATVRASVGGVSYALLDDGIAPDSTARDGEYVGYVASPKSAADFNVVITASAPEKNSVTNTLSYVVAEKPPSNDNFADSIKVPSEGGVYRGNLYFATVEPDEPPHRGAAIRTTRSVWWTYSANATNVLFDLGGAGSGNVGVSVYQGDKLTALRLVSSNYFAAGTAARSLTANLVPGQLYRVAVFTDIAQGTAFDGRFRLRIAPGVSADIQPPTLALDKAFLDNVIWPYTNLVVSGTARDFGVNASGLKGVVVGIRQGNLQLPNPSVTNNVDDPFGKWSVGVPLSTNGLPTTIIAYSEDFAGNISTKVTNTYYFAASGTTGGNDLFKRALALTGTIGSIIQSNSNATLEFKEPLHAGQPGGKSLWYSFSAPEDGVLNLTTAGSDRISIDADPQNAGSFVTNRVALDTLLAVYTGSNVTSLNMVVSNDDADQRVITSEVSLAVRKGKPVYIALDTFNGQSGFVHLNHAFSPSKVYQIDVAAAAGGSTVPSGSTLFPEFAAVTLSATPTNRYSKFQSFKLTPGGVITNNPYTFLVTGDVKVETVFGSNSFSDDFENGDFSRIPWVASNWGILNNSTLAPSSLVPTNGGAFSAYSLNSSAAGLDGTDAVLSLLITNLDAPGLGKFDLLVSSEKDYDRLEFRLGDALLSSWSGETGWRTFEFAVPRGVSKLTWTYSKDAVFGGGLDLAAIDNLELPPSVIFGSSPVLKPASLSFNGSGGPVLSATATGVPGQFVLLQQAKTLDSAWTTIQVLTIGADGTATYSGLDTSGQMMFFRLITQAGN